MYNLRITVLGYFIFIGYLVDAFPPGEDLNMPEILAKLDSVLEKTDQRIAPIDKDGTTGVRVALFITDIYDIDEQSMECKMNIMLMLMWKDFRMFNLSDSMIPITDRAFIDKVWIPGVFFSNSQYVKFHKIMVPNQFLSITPGGRILLFRRYSVGFACRMDFRKFPFDNQSCSFEISYFISNNGRLEWMNDGIIVHSRVKLSQFVFTGTETLECDDEFTFDDNRTTCLQAVLNFNRRLGFYLVNIYIPSIMIVAVSWTSFWMDINSVPGRVALCITTVLTISSKATSVQSMTAEVSYVKAVDIWMMVCTALVFISLCEFIVANYLWRMSSSRRIIQLPSSADMDESAECKKKMNKAREAYLDKLSRILFPLAFALFNAVYWCYYML